MSSSLSESQQTCILACGLSDCDLLHKQVTLFSNGLLCHCCTPLPRRFLLDYYSDE